jgi:transcriptional regulator with XRE-family HTH domain
MSPRVKTYPQVQIQFGRRLKELREALHLTRDELAELADLSPQNVAKIEAGERFVTADSLERLAAALSVKPFELFVFEGEGHRKSAGRRKIETLMQMLQHQDDRKLAMVHDVATRILKD